MVLDNPIEPFSPNENYRPAGNQLSPAGFPASSSFDELMMNGSGKTSTAASSFFSSMKNNNNITNNKLFLIEPKAVCILGNEPIMVRRLSDPPPMMPASIFLSPPPTDRPYRSVYNRKVINVYPSDHFGLCGTFQFQL